MRLPWSRGLFVRSAAHFWPLVAWTGFWAFILYGLLPSRARPCLIMGFSLFNPFFTPSVGLLTFLPCHSAILVVILFDPCLLGLFWTCCMLLFYLILAAQYIIIGLAFMLFRAFLIHSIAYGLPRPIYSFWASSAHSNSTFLWVLANSFGLPRPNYHILYFWGSWAFHQPFTYFTTSGLLWPILTFHFT